MQGALYRLGKGAEVRSDQFQRAAQVGQGRAQRMGHQPNEVRFHLVELAKLGVGLPLFPSVKPLDCWGVEFFCMPGEKINFFPAGRVGRLFTQHANWMNRKSRP